MEMSGDHVYVNNTFEPENQVNTGGTSAEEENIYENPNFRDTAAVIPSTGQEAGTVKHTHTRQRAGTVKHTHTHQTRSRYS